jgi:hypothetical protein
MMIFLGVACLVVFVGAVCWACFRIGYNTGWHERHMSMILPRNIAAALSKRLDDDATHHRHSAMDPKKVF